MQFAQYWNRGSASKALSCSTYYPNISGLERGITRCFQERVGQFLSQITDEPQLTGYTAIRKTDSYSLVDMIKIVSFSRDRHLSANP